MNEPDTFQNRSEKEIFFAALDKNTPEERAAFLDGICGKDPARRARVEALLAHHFQQDSFMKKPAAEGVRPTIKTSPVQEATGTVIGRYKLLQQIGEGGCGVVYVADQGEPVKRRVALKVIKPGMDTREVLGRFEAERQALAMMDHPNIAKVLEAGATETGRPFFVMELVRGIPITRYCDENKLNTEQRLDLFVQVCQAIQHAHQKGIIHRDIKPSNVLVADHDGLPVPKIIDFGISKATSGQTLTDKTIYTALEQFIGTPAYMSPEQAKLSGLDIDTRSDIYSLGVLLYELLTGKTPFDARRLFEAGFDEIRRIIREEEPARPSQKISTLTVEEQTTTAQARQTDSPRLVHLVRGDLDWIVMKCLEKDRNRRYETANGLASDLRRHLNNEPVVARPPSNVYRFQKLVRRNKLFFAAIGAVAAALLLGLVVSAWQARRATRAGRAAEAEAVRATRAETLAEQRLSESESITKFLTDVFQTPDAASSGRTINMAARLGAAAKKLESDPSIQPTRRVKLQATLGSTYAALGLYLDAIALQEKVRDYYLATSGSEHPDTVRAMSALAYSYNALAWKLATSDAAEIRSGTNAVRLAEDAVAATRRRNALFLDTLAATYAETQHFDKAVATQKEAMGLLQREQEKKDYAARLQLYQANLPYREADTISTMRNLADSYCSAGCDEAAIALVEKLCEKRRKNASYSLTLATWQTWFGHDADYEATRRCLVQQVDGTNQAAAAERLAERRDARAYYLRPFTDAALLTKVLNLAQHDVERRKGFGLPLDQFALGMAEYRSGQYPAAEQNLSEAAERVRNLPIQRTARLFRAMGLFRQNRLEEARKLFSQVEAEMPPLPKDERKPLVDGKLASYDELICWLAYKEAKSLLNAPAAAKP